MKTLLFLFSAMLIGYSQNQNSNLTTVPYVDLNKYAGVWYEVAKIPNSFQKHCIKNTTAKYELLKDGEIRVINSCVDEDGELDKTEGLARIVDKKSNSKLEVSFFSILGWRPVWGDYWIIGLGKDYEYAVIGTPSRKYGWILSRTPKLSEEKMKEAYSILQNQGYNTKLFVAN